LVAEQRESGGKGEETVSAVVDFHMGFRRGVGFLLGLVVIFRTRGLGCG
jgi:hypothetical protein